MILNEFIYLRYFFPIFNSQLWLPLPHIARGGPSHMTGLTGSVAVSQASKKAPSLDTCDAIDTLDQVHDRPQLALAVSARIGLLAVAS